MSDSYSISLPKKDAKIKLPKQWRHWCKLAGLKRMGRGDRSQFADFYLTGRGRVWRVNCYGQFQCGDTYAEFDRWALCDIRQADSLPQTQQEFLATVKDLLAQHKDQ